MIIIAEIGHNFNGDFTTAKELIKAAKDCGCDYAKFQLYNTDTIKRPGDTNYDELKRSELTFYTMNDLNEHAKYEGIDFMCSVFDLERLDWYMTINPKVHKIASRSIYNNELIDTMIKTEIPIIASLGSWEDKEFPHFEAKFLFCLSRRQILNNGVHTFPKDFTEYTGFSDHTIGIDYAKMAIDRGAEIIEKHFTFNKNAPGWDQCSSAIPNEMKELVRYAKS